MDKQSRQAIYAGIDIAKHRLDVHLCPTNEAFSVTRDEKASNWAANAT